MRATSFLLLILLFHRICCSHPLAHLRVSSTTQLRFRSLLVSLTRPPSISYLPHICSLSPSLRSSPVFFSLPHKVYASSLRDHIPSTFDMYPKARLRSEHFSVVLSLLNLSPPRPDVTQSIRYPLRPSLISISQVHGVTNIALLSSTTLLHNHTFVIQLGAIYYFHVHQLCISRLYTSQDIPEPNLIEWIPFDLELLQLI